MPASKACPGKPHSDAKAGLVSVTFHNEAFWGENRKIGLARIFIYGKIFERNPCVAGQKSEPASSIFPGCRGSPDRLSSEQPRWNPGRRPPGFPRSGGYTQSPNPYEFFSVPVRNKFCGLANRSDNTKPKACMMNRLKRFVLKSP
jgi:hypothetical protein